MNVLHTAICFFLLFLLDGNADAQDVYTRTEGVNLQVQCPSSSSGSRKIFCKNQCRQEDVLIETTGVRAQDGRYGIQWIHIGGTSQGDVFLTITQLTKSDSGVYWCLSRDFTPKNKQIEIIVVNAQLRGLAAEEKTLNSRTGGDVTVACFLPRRTGSRKIFCKGRCENQEDFLIITTDDTAHNDRYSTRYIAGGLYVSIKRLTTSDSGWYACGLVLASQLQYRQFEILVTDVPSASTAAATTQSLSSTSGIATPSTTEGTSTRDVLLYAGLTLVIMILVSLAVLMFCRRRAEKRDEPPQESQYANVTETNRVYEDIGEDREHRSPVEISSVHARAKYTHPNGAEADDDFYSVVTAANIQNAEDSNRLTYSEVTFSNAGSSSAFRDDGDNLIYSTPRIRSEDDPY